MPGGLITEDWQVELNSLLTGAGTGYVLDVANIGGLGAPPAKTSDLDLNHAAGSYLGRDYAGARVITIPYVVLGSTPADAADMASDLTEAWAASETDVELHIRLPGFGHVMFVGRPRGLPLDLRELRACRVDALGTFICGDPTMNPVTGS